MKIVNMNSITKQWTVWNKTYCQDLNNKITSLYDYIIWNYPEYLILNTPTKLHESSSFQSYKSLSNSIEESRLGDHPYEYDVTLVVKENEEATTTTTQNRALFIPTRLNYHQGFYNQSNDGDGILCAIINVKDVEDPMFMSISVNQNEYTQIFKLNEDKTAYNIYKAMFTSSYYETTVQDEYYFWNEENGWDSSNYSDGKQNAVKYLHICEQEYSPKLNFPSGYVCICSKQTTGEASEYNLNRYNLDSYIVAPMGNGGYYDIYWNHNILEAHFQPNDFNNFTNKITINLATNCRYLNPTPDTTFNSYNTITIDNLIEGVPHLSDAHSNLWTGQKDLVGYMANQNGEHIFADVQYSTYQSVQENQSIYHFSVHTTESSLKNLEPRLKIY